MGLRLGRPGLILAAGLVAGGCFGPSVQEEAALAVHRDGSRTFYERGNYFAALQQAEAAIAIDDGQPEMHIVRGLCLMRIGKDRANVAMLDESVAIFDGLVDDFDVDEQYEAYLGAGSAHLVRALEHQSEIGRIDRRLLGSFLSEDGRRSEERQRDEEQRAMSAHLADAERAFWQVLALERHQDNPYALVDLALVLGTQGGRDEEAVALGRRAIEVLDESSRLAQRQLDKNLKLSNVARIELQALIDGNRDRETLLRDVLATIYFNRNDFDSCLAELTAMEERQLMGEPQHLLRADIFERRGDYPGAIADLEAVLRLRSRYLDYEEDDLAPVVFSRITALRTKSAGR